ncbi:E3 SUMO-protein ligase NSE2 [Sergentomyia squamirostris]
MMEKHTKIPKLARKIFLSMDATLQTFTREEFEALGGFNVYEDLMKKVCHREIDGENKATALATADRKSDPADFKEDFRKEYSGCEINVSDSKKYRKFLQFKQAYLDGAGPSTTSEEMTVTETVQTVDPFTKKPLQNPVRNKTCNHVYDRDCLKNIIKLNNRVRCPYVGCSNKSRLRMEDVEEDDVLKMQMMRNQNEDSD